VKEKLVNVPSVPTFSDFYFSWMSPVFRGFQEGLAMLKYVVALDGCPSSRKT
jgi:hypothetical protein